MSIRQCASPNRPHRGVAWTWARSGGMFSRMRPLGVCALTLSLFACSSPAFAGQRLRPAPIDPPPLPPGGYYSVGDFPEIEPPDGERAIITGSVLFPLGVIRTALGVMQVHLAKPERCQYSAESCRGLTTYGWIGVSYGGISAVTGLAFLGIGLARRNRLRRWRAARNLSWTVEPQVGRDRAAVQLWLHF